MIKKIKKHLTREQRYQIDALRQNGTSQKEIARILQKDKSVISREIKRNQTTQGKYCPAHAQRLADERKERFKRKRTFTVEMKQYLIKALREEQWSSEQIVGKAKKEGREMVSQERIYQFIREDKAAGGTLYKELRHRLKHRKRPVDGKKIVIPDKISIEQRPDIINKKQRFGDWEIDTIVGKENKGAMLTATERKTGFLLMKKLPLGKNANALAEELYYMFLPYKEFVLSITSDNGTEFYEHKMIAKRRQADFFFASPYSSWERGLNEYTNKLIRQYIPKKQTFENYDEEAIKAIQYKINRRPRKLLNFDNPFQVFTNERKKSVALDT
jgi:IS30 family transposase